MPNARRRWSWGVLLVAAPCLLAGCRFTSTPVDAVFACEEGKCPEGMSCAGGYCVKASAVCEPRTCARVGANCGEVEDGCGHTLDCGACTEPESCGGGGTANVCGADSCIAETDPVMCARFNRSCGTLADKDNCGHDRTVECGLCPPGQTCGGGGVPFQCDRCVPLTAEEICARDGIVCVSAYTVQNCGQLETVSCGCGNGFCLEDGECCIPAPDETYCAGRCGPRVVVDNCGLPRELSCGGCDGGTCTDDGVCGACVPETDLQLCARLGKSCGPFTAEDNYGVERTVDCGACDPSGPGCGTITPNVCGCNANLNTCSSNADCCSGTCGPAQLCCVPFNGSCNDESDCCQGECALGICAPFHDAGS